MPKPDLYAGRVIAERYRLARLLGQGGFGFVYEASHVKLPKRFAMKFLHRQHAIDEQFLKRFEREAQVTARLEHPSIVSVTDFGEDPDLGHYFVMEFLEGQTLLQRIRTGGPLACGEAVALMRRMTDAFVFAHGHGVIHRDVKSANIVLTRSPSGEVVPKILDFGIAKVAETPGEDAERLTRSGMMMGSLSYMSPEQGRGQPTDARSDLYSLGVILYEMITGRVPFQADSAFDLVNKHVNEPPKPPSVMRPDLAIHPMVEQIVLRCLQKDPARRYADAKEMADALAAADAFIRSGEQVPAEVVEQTRLLERQMVSEGSLREDTPSRPPARSAENAKPSAGEPERKWAVALAGLVLAAAVIAWVAAVTLKPRRAPAPVLPVENAVVAAVEVTPVADLPAESSPAPPDAEAAPAQAGPASELVEQAQEAAAAAAPKPAIGVVLSSANQRACPKASILGPYLGRRRS